MERTSSRQESQKWELKHPNPAQAYKDEVNDDLVTCISSSAPGRRRRRKGFLCFGLLDPTGHLHSCIRRAKVMHGLIFDARSQ